jgi:hypothetical protein
MVLKSALAAVFCTGLLALSSPAAADEYRPDEFFGLDLSRAVLSPKRLGPDTEFAPVPIEANADRGTGAAQARAEPRADRPKVVRTTRVAPEHVAQRDHARPRVAARTKLARRHGNPLDAQARDTRIQVWPCKSGGICNWRR